MRQVPGVFSMSRKSLASTSLAVTGACFSLSLVLTGAASAQTAPASSTPVTTPAPVTPEIVVKGQVKGVVHKIDRTVYDLKDNLQAQSGSVGDVLNTLPSVNVDPNGNVSVRGGSVQVMVDGKPSAALKGSNLATALQSMPANTIAKIEVITNPGPEFRTDASTVINIITRKARGPAPAGSLTVNEGPQARYNGTLAGTAGIGKWSFSGMANFRQDRRYDILDSGRDTLNPDGSVAQILLEHRPTRVPYGHVSINGDASYAATDNDTISFSANADQRRRPRTYVDSLTTLTPAGDVIDDSDTFDTAHQHFNDVSADSVYTHKGPADGEILTVQLRHEEDDNLRSSPNDQHFLTPAQPDYLYYQFNTERELDDDINADFVRPWSDTIQFKAGFDIDSDRNQSYNLESTTDPVTGAVTIDPDGTNRFYSASTLSAAYVSYQHPVGKWNVEGGLRVEHMQTRLHHDVASGEVTTSDTQWSPSLYISRDFTPQSTVNLSYSRRIDRPWSGQLDPLPSPVIAQSQSVGNPYLQPGQTQSFEASYVYTTKPVTFSGTLYVRQLDHQITQYSYYPNPADGILVSSWENAGHGHSGGLDLSIDLHPNAKWAISASSNIMAIAQSAPAGGLTLAQSIVTQTSKLNISYTPVPADTFQVQTQLNGDSLTAQGRAKGYDVLNLSYRHKFSPRLKLIININDALNSVRHIEYDQAAQFRAWSRLNVPGQLVYVGLDVKLGALQPVN